MRFVTVPFRICLLIISSHSTHIETRSFRARRQSNLFTETIPRTLESSIGNIEEYNILPAVNNRTFKIIRQKIEVDDNIFGFPDICPLPMLSDSVVVLEESHIIPNTEETFSEVNKNMELESPKPRLKNSPNRKRGKSMELIQNVFKKVKRALTPSRKCGSSKVSSFTPKDEKTCTKYNIIKKSKNNLNEEEAVREKSLQREATFGCHSKSFAQNTETINALETSIVIDRPVFKIIRQKFKTEEETFGFPDVCPLPMLSDSFVVSEASEIVTDEKETCIEVQKNTKSESPKQTFEMPHIRKRGRSREIIDNFYKKAKTALTPPRKCRLSNDLTKSTIDKRLGQGYCINESTKNNSSKQEKSRGRNRQCEVIFTKCSKNIMEIRKSEENKVLETYGFIKTNKDIANNLKSITKSGEKNQSQLKNPTNCKRENIRKTHINQNFVMNVYGPIVNTYGEKKNRKNTTNEDV